jgi:YHYH protein
MITRRHGMPTNTPDGWIMRHTPLLSLALSGALAGCGSGNSTDTATPVDPVPQTGVACGLATSEFNGSTRVNLTSTATWTCTSSVRTLTANGIPNHPVTSGSFATAISAQNIAVAMRLAPTLLGSNTTGVTFVPGYALNGVKLDPATAGSCTATATSTAPGAGCVATGGANDPWRLEAIGGAFVFGTDESNAHTQPNGQYHYHGLPEAYLTKLNKGAAMTLVGFSVDGFPIYARYGFATASSAQSAVRLMVPSWRLKATPDAGRPAVNIFPMGTFTADYEYVAGSGDLDECNGRTGVTPEFPSGTYHYFITETYPYIQRCVKGVVGAA